MFMLIIEIESIHFQTQTSHFVKDTIKSHFLAHLLRDARPLILQRQRSARAVYLAYIEGRELVIDIQLVLDGVAHGADDPVDDVHHAVGGHLVTVDDPGAVHRHDLRGAEIQQ